MDPGPYTKEKNWIWIWSEYPNSESFLNHLSSELFVFIYQSYNLKTNYQFILEKKLRLNLMTSGPDLFFQRSDPASDPFFSSRGSDPDPVQSYPDPHLWTKVFLTCRTFQPGRDHTRSVQSSINQCCGADTLDMRLQDWRTDLPMVLYVQEVVSHFIY